MLLKLTIAYDGTRFGGWQIQPNADTIQGRIEEALAEVAKEKIRLHGSGRTDAGVHALGQVAHFDAPEHLTMNPFNWVPALNAKLPSEIRIMECAEAPDEFHARFSARSKTYTYRLCLSPILPPFLAQRAWHLEQSKCSPVRARYDRPIPTRRCSMWPVPPSWRGRRSSARAPKLSYVA